MESVSVFIFKNEGRFPLERGVAVVVADSPEDALRTLQEYESDPLLCFGGPRLSHRARLEDLVKVQVGEDTKGVILYYIPNRDL